MRKIFILLLLILPFCASARKLPKLESTVGVGTFTFLYGLVDVDPGPNYRGDYLPENDKIGIQIFTNNGFTLAKRLHLTVGLGYANYDGTSGALVSGNFMADVLKTRFTPVIYANAGYSHFWNQYPGGTGTGILELGGGVKYKLLKHALTLTAGNQIMQRNQYFAVKAGFTF